MVFHLVEVTQLKLILFGMVTSKPGMVIIGAWLYLPAGPIVEIYGILLTK